MGRLHRHGGWRASDDSLGTTSPVSSRPAVVAPCAFRWHNLPTAISPPSRTGTLTTLVGRAQELTLLTSALETARQGRGSVHLVTGEGGVGKTRLTVAVGERARERGFTVVTGRAFPVETGIPYALFADGFVPMMREMSSASLQTLSRGAVTELAMLFPTLRADGAPPTATTTAGDLKSRLLDSFTQLLGRLAERQPLLLVLENLQWADPSSIDLFHFVARRAHTHPMVVLSTYNDTQLAGNRGLRAAEQSLRSLGALERHTLSPLDRDETEALVCAISGESPAAIGDFADRIHARTRGNPFFIRETFQALVGAGRLRREGERWVGWKTEQLSLPDSIRDALALRHDRLSAGAQRIVAIAAVVGTHVPHLLLARLGGLDGPSLLEAIDELLRERLLEETDGAVGPAYLFTHPLLQEMLYGEMSRARTQLLHAEIADALEAQYGAEAMARAEELAVHFRRADAPSHHARAVRYLTQAGHLAMARGANREAVESLEAARALVERGGDATAVATERAAVLEPLLALLARGRNRLGDYAGASRLWREGLVAAEERGDAARVATFERRLGIAAVRSGDVHGALAHLERSLTAAGRARDRHSEASAHLARSELLTDIGRGEEAESDLQRALAIAEAIGEPRLLARVHLALQSLAVWQGPPDGVREHGARALAFAEASADTHSIWAAQWTQALHAGLTGDRPGTAVYLAEAARLAEELRSPLLRMWTAEVRIEYLSGTGEWDEALALADRSIEEARAFGQRLLLPRLLVWSALIHLGRGDFAEAKGRIDEAWQLSGADRASDDGSVNVHSVVVAHIGLGYYHLYRREYRQALEVGERGLAIADRTGYSVWAVYRLLPLLAETCLWLNTWENSAAYAKRLRAEGELLGHPLALAWANATDALLMRFLGDVAGAVTRLREAAEALEAIPFTEHAARLRRKLAEPLVQLGDTAGAIAELRSVHDVFARLGATPALDEVREKLRELGVRPPAKSSSAGAGIGALTAREVEIARLVAERKTNKEIGVALGISARTVGTHLANIFQKLGVDSRGALTDLVRASGRGAPAILG